MVRVGLRQASLMLTGTIMSSRYRCALRELLPNYVVHRCQRAARRQKMKPATPERRRVRPPPPPQFHSLVGCAWGDSSGRVCSTTVGGAAGPEFERPHKARLRTHRGIDVKRCRWGQFSPHSELWDAEFGGQLWTDSDLCRPIPAESGQSWPHNRQFGLSLAGFGRFLFAGATLPTPANYEQTRAIFCRRLAGRLWSTSTEAGPILDQFGRPEFAEHGANICRYFNNFSRRWSTSAQIWRKSATTRPTSWRNW